MKPYGDIISNIDRFEKNFTEQVVHKFIYKNELQYNVNELKIIELYINIYEKLIRNFYHMESVDGYETESDELGNVKQAKMKLKQVREEGGDSS